MFEDAVFAPIEKIGPDWFTEEKIRFYMDNKTKITFRLRDMPEYFFTGIVESIERPEYDEEDVSGYYDIARITIALDNGEKMLFVSDDILALSLHPSSIEPIKNFQRAKIPDATREEVFESCNNECEIKGENCTGKATEMDHIIPVSLGGGNQIYNLQGSCSNCNKKKSNKV